MKGLEQIKADEEAHAKMWAERNLMRLRVELYTAAQTFKGDDLAEFCALISEIAIVLGVINCKPAKPAEVSP